VARVIERIFPVVMLLASIGASLGYLYVADMRRAIYWAAAAVITAAVTF
jgi:hypothetical protein